jgi:hypothetical protein
MDPAPKSRQQTTWAEFIRSHLSVLAGIDFFTVEVLTWRGLATYYVLFFLHLETRRVTLAGITQHPAEEWMVQMARNAVDDIDGALLGTRFALHDRDTKFCSSFRTMLQSSGVQPILLPPRSPNLNAFAERWVRSIKEECLSKLILFGEASLRRTATEFTKHYHRERNHQGEQATLSDIRFSTTMSQISGYSSRAPGWTAEVLPTGCVKCFDLMGSRIPGKRSGVHQFPR